MIDEFHGFTSFCLRLSMGQGKMALGWQTAVIEIMGSS
jgi:hypothetical protein